MLNFVRDEWYPPLRVIIADVPPNLGGWSRDGQGCTGT